MDKKRPISDLQKRIEQLEERKRQILRLAKERERKKRAYRLIQTGALAEKYFELEHLTIPEREELFKIFANYINEKKPDKFKKKE
ncbi:hypothetical protein ABEV12_09910 [Geobacillus stearothermophilus]|uniref:hypothetical protein n=1 Tax=Geobacillus stearothermophilus TaxID=1422 RepID=UPI000519547B|nr:hypothetical protein [Geobacillus stearothermophilus]MED4333562.1 hypothetical protein [Geobacillus stearothermophilus]